MAQAQKRLTSGPSAARAAVVVVCTAVVAAVMVRLALWQWGRGRARGSLLNYSYAVEWVCFAILFMVGAIVLLAEGWRDATASPPAQQPEQAADISGHPRRAPVIGPPLAADEQLPDVTYQRILRRLRLGR